MREEPSLGLGRAVSGAPKVIVYLSICIYSHAQLKVMEHSVITFVP
jgi:hypothetical protein